LKKITGKYLLLTFILLVSLLPVSLPASNFIGIGTGAYISGTFSGDGNETGIHVPVIFEYEYSPDYRDQWLFNTCLNYLPEINNDNTGNLFLFSAGIKYVPRFYFYHSNITESTFHKSSCLGILLLPLTVVRDAINNIAQYGIPSHPFILLDYSIIKTEEKIHFNAFSAGAGITSGLIDIKFKYSQNLNFNGGLHRDIYLAGMEFTLHVPLQEKFVMEKPLIE